MDLLSFFQRLNKQGVKLVLNNGSLNVKSNKRVDQQLLLEIKSNKRSIIEYLKKYQGENAAELQEKYQCKNTSRTLLEKLSPFNKNNVEKIPLSFNQDRLWFLDQLEGTLAYHLPTVISLEGSLDIATLEKSLKTIVSRHEVLRTNLKAAEGIGYQQIVSEENWSLDQIKVTEETIKTTLQDYINIPFDLSNDYKLRACLYHLRDEKYVLACVFHHIASDGWSSNILVGELVELYGSIRFERKTELPELTLQYSDYSIWQRKYIKGDVLESQLSYWEEKLKGVSTLSLPTDYPRSSIQSIEGSSIFLELDLELSSTIRSICQKEGVTLFMFMLSVFKVLLSRYSGQDDISVGTPIANRTQSDLEGMIGFFANTLVLRSDLGGSPSFIELLSRIKETTLEGYDHQLVPFDKVVERVVSRRDIGINPLFQVMFVLQNASIMSMLNEEKLDGIAISNYELDVFTSQFDLMFSAKEHSEGIAIHIEYRTALFKEETIARIAGHF
ncbi:condensation domain-containing protein, partial [Snuella sedimenti]